EDRQVPHRRDDRNVARLRDLVHAGLAGEHGRAVHPHPARAADHHPAALPVRERPVVTVLDDVEHVEERHPLGRIDLVLAQGALARLRRDAPDLQRDLHLPTWLDTTTSDAGGGVTLTGVPKSERFIVRTVWAFS